MSATMQELLQDVVMEGVNVMLTKRRGERIPMVLDGLKPRRPSTGEGLQRMTPEQLVTLRVDAVGVNGRVTGYQRDLDFTHARRIAQWLREGKPLPTVHVAVDGHGRMSIVDGQHRVAAAIMARLPLDVIVRRLDKQEQADLFFSQRRAKTVDPNVLTLAGTGPYERYVQDALTNPQHAWNGMVSARRDSKTRIGPYAMYQLLIRYVANREGQSAGVKKDLDLRWDAHLADELAPLIACFGNKQTNALAFRPWTLQAIGGTAMWVFRRRDEIHPDDHGRWVSHMPRFAFEDFLFLRAQRQMTDALLNHWNKRLTGSRRITR